MPTKTGTTETKPRPSRKKRSAEDTARSYFEALGARDPDAMAKHWHAEGIEDIVPVGILRGPDEIRDFFRATIAAVPDAETVVEALVADEGNTMVRWRMTGTFTGGEFQGIAPTGSRIELRGCDHLEVKDGKIVRNTAYYDGMSFARGIGMMPPLDSGAERAMKAAFNAVTRGRSLVREKLANR